MALLRMLLVLALAGGAIAVVTLLTVQEREEFVALHAESFEISGALSVASSTLTVAGANVPAKGSGAEPVEIGESRPWGTTTLTKSHWVYNVTIDEAAVDAVATGTFQVELTMNGASKGAVVVTQGSADATKVEGAVLGFDLGASLPGAPLFLVRITSYAVPVDYQDVTLKTTGGTAFYQGTTTNVNPAVSFPAARTLRLTVENDDNSLHQVSVFQAQTRLKPPAAADTNVDADGETATVVWAPPAAGAYQYRCEYHSSWNAALAKYTGMAGDITVTA